MWFCINYNKVGIIHNWNDMLPFKAGLLAALASTFFQTPVLKFKIYIFLHLLSFFLLLFSSSTFNFILFSPQVLKIIFPGGNKWNIPPCQPWYTGKPPPLPIEGLILGFLYPQSELQMAMQWPKNNTLKEQNIQIPHFLAYTPKRYREISNQNV